MSLCCADEAQEPLMNCESHEISCENTVLDKTPHKTNFCGSGVFHFLRAAFSANFFFGGEILRNWQPSNIQVFSLALALLIHNKHFIIFR
jgi:hypothetical protein